VGVLAAQGGLASLVVVVSKTHGGWWSHRHGKQGDAVAGAAYYLHDAEVGERELDYEKVKRWTGSAASTLWSLPGGHPWMGSGPSDQRPPVLSKQGGSRCSAPSRPR
jgi:hypothetical protein